MITCGEVRHTLRCWFWSCRGLSARCPAWAGPTAGRRQPGAGWRPRCWIRIASGKSWGSQSRWRSWREHPETLQKWEGRSAVLLIWLHLEAKTTEILQFPIYCFSKHWWWVPCLSFAVKKLWPCGLFILLSWGLHGLQLGWECVCHSDVLVSAEQRNRTGSYSLGYLQYFII